METNEWDAYVGDQMRLYPTLTQKEIVELYKGRNPDNLHKIKLAHLRYIHKFSWAVVKKCGGHKEIGDILNHAYLLLDEVVERYSPDVPNAVPFCNYLSCHLNYRIKAYLLDDTIIRQQQKPVGGKYTEIISIHPYIDDNGDKQNEQNEPSDYRTPYHYCVIDEMADDLDILFNQAVDKIMQEPNLFVEFKQKYKGESREKLEEIIKLWVLGHGYAGTAKIVGTTHTKIRGIIAGLQNTIAKITRGKIKKLDRRLAKIKRKRT